MQNKFLPVQRLSSNCRA